MQLGFTVADATLVCVVDDLWTVEGNSIKTKLQKEGMSCMIVFAEVTFILMALSQSPSYSCQNFVIKKKKDAGICVQGSVFSLKLFLHRGVNSLEMYPSCINTAS